MGAGLVVSWANQLSAGVPGLEPRLAEPESAGLPITPYPIGSTTLADRPPAYPAAASGLRRLAVPGPLAGALRMAVAVRAGRRRRGRARQRSAAASRDARALRR